MTDLFLSGKMYVDEWRLSTTILIYATQWKLSDHNKPFFFPVPEPEALRRTLACVARVASWSSVVIASNDKTDRPIGDKLIALIMAQPEIRGDNNYWHALRGR